MIIGKCLKTLLPRQRGRIGFGIFFMAVVCLLLGAMPGRAAGKHVLHGHVPAAVSYLTPVRYLQGSQHLNLAISLPLRNQQALDDLLRQINDPSSPNYRHYLTPEQFTQQFGPSEADYMALINFAKSHGLNVTEMHPNRMILDVEGSVSNIQGALAVTLLGYQHPSEAREFYAPNTEPSVDLDVPILHISGLDNYSLPHPRYKVNSRDAKAPVGNAQAYTVSSNSGGSAPNGCYMGNDFRAAYAPGVALTGSGQTVGLLQFDGYTASDITYYENLAGLPHVTLTNVLLDGFNGTPTGNGGEVEVSLDIEMAISMAPGASNIIVYEAGPNGNWHDILNRMATDNLAKQISCSWYSSGQGADPVADQIFQQMAAQGQSFFSASGDSDAFTGLIPFPGDTPYITEVGGTTLTTSGFGGPYASETVWNWGGGSGSGGGISTQYSIPTWQQGISMTGNLGSTTKRNVPDVALTADNVYVRANGVDQNIGGTSCAAPLWAGFMALVNQQAVMNGLTTVGFINPAIYAIGKGTNYTSDFHDTTTGNNFSSSSPAKFPAAGGYDLCTGWGTPNGIGLINALAGPPTPIITTTSPLPTGVVGAAYSQTLAATGGSPTYTWSISSGSLPLNLSLSSAGVISGTATVAGTASFTVKVTDSRGASSTTAFSLTISSQGAPIIATRSPLPSGTVGSVYNQTLTASGGATPYTWTVISGSLPLGLSLSSAGVISGTPSMAGTSSFSVQVTGSNSLSSTATFSLTVNPVPTPPTITTSSPLLKGTVGVAYNQTLKASGGTLPYTWSISSGSLPAGLSLSSTGVISGTPSAATTANFTVTVTGGDSQFSTKAFSLTIAQRILYFPLDTDPGWSRQGQWAFGHPTGQGGTQYGYPDPSNGATGSNVFGVNLSGDYSTVVGGPYYLTAGPFNFSNNTGMTLQFQRWLNSDYQPYVTDTVEVSNNGTTWTAVFSNPWGASITDSAWTQVSYDISSVADGHSNVYVRWSYAIESYAYPYSGWNIDDVAFFGSGPVLPSSPVITSTLSASATQGQAFSYQIAATNSPTSYGASGLPAGLGVNTSTGLISGTPTVAGTFNATISAKNASGTGSAGLTITVTVKKAPSITNGPPPAANLKTPYSFTYTASGSPAPTFSIASGALPPGLGLSSSGVISGTPKATGTYAGSVKASNGAGTATQSFSIAVK